MSKRNVFSDEELKEWLGDTSGRPQTGQVQVESLATRRDPRSRFVQASF